MGGRGFLTAGVLKELLKGIDESLTSVELVSADFTVGVEVLFDY